MEMQEAGKPRASWLWYGGEILTLFLALTVLTGRVYSQSYWNVFGLSPELIGTNFVNYAIVSPNAALASLLMALGTVALVAILVRRQPTNIIGTSSPTAVYYIGCSTCFIGLIVIGIIMQVDSSKWTNGTAGMVFGLGYLVFVGGLIAYMEALSKKWEGKGPSKLDKFLLGWVKKVPFILVQIFFIVGIISASLWGILDTAQKFGANEAKFMYNTRPWVTIQLDSPTGFEDLTVSLSSDGATLVRVKMITEASGFLYVTPGFTQAQEKLHIRAVPVSRVQAIQYEVIATPIGE
ncbi:MAG TPA: hypothetical protein VMW60_01650 [Dehalococcoidales bacterium]|nr:hypothetical protein [Dehalococcoidales bacterium]